MSASRTLTRDELYTLVWSTPMQTLAKEFGVTGRGLAKICDRLAVPYPYRGYWARVGAGQHAARYQLRAAKPGTPDRVEISPTSTQPGQAVTPTPAAADAAAPSPAPPVQTVKVGTRLSSPHRIIAAWIEEARRSDAWSARIGVGPSSPSPRQRRERLILDALFKALERRGHRIETERGSLHQVRWLIGGQPFGYKFRERYTQRRVPMTPEELKDPWNVRQGRTTKTVREDTGELVLAVQSEAFSWWVKAEWKDQPEQPLEDQLGLVLARLEVMAEEAKAHEAEKAEEARRRAIAEQARYESEQRQKRDANRFRRLRDLAERQAEAERLQAFLARLREQLGNEPPAEAADWLAWAQAKLEAFAPLSGGADAIIAEVQAIGAYDYG